MTEIPLSHTYSDAIAMAKYYEQEFAFSLVREGEFRDAAERLEARVAEQAAKIKALEETNTHLQEEAERYYEESRASAKTLGGILRVLRDNNVGWNLMEERSNEQE